MTQEPGWKMKKIEIPKKIRTVNNQHHL